MTATMNGHTGGPVSPAVQMRLSLERARGYDRDFDQAWDSAFANVRWPHDTTHRREWKGILDDPNTKEIWRSAYYLAEPLDRRKRKQLSISRVAIAA